MKELTIGETEKVAGGVVAHYWVAKGAVYAYKKYKVVEKVTDAAAGIAAGQALYGD